MNKYPKLKIPNNIQISKSRNTKVQRCHFVKIATSEISNSDKSKHRNAKIMQSKCQHVKSEEMYQVNVLTCPSTKIILCRSTQQLKSENAKTSQCCNAKMKNSQILKIPKRRIVKY